MPHMLQARAEVQPNNGMHPTADTPALMYINVAGRRVMPGVRRLLASPKSEMLAGLILTTENSCGSRAGRD